MPYTGRKRGRGGRFRKGQRGYYRKSGYYGKFSGANPELKFKDSDIDDAVIASSGTVLGSWNLIAQGVTESTRVGRKCTIRQINWRWTVTLPALMDAADMLSDEVRLIVYLDKQTNGANATVTGILESADYQSFNNLANKSRFRILYDKSVVLNPSAGSTDGASTVSVPEVIRSGSFYKKCSIPLEFDSTTGAITEIRSNNIACMTISKNGVASLNSKVRLRFSDM